MKPCLIILAAGVGSRYGGLKQLESIGPNNEALLDYSVLDALRAGFGKIILVVREEIQTQVEAHVESTFGSVCNIAYAVQSTSIKINGEVIHTGKPLGTGHAVLSAISEVNSPFAVINADDYYGPSAFNSMADFLIRSANENHYAMIGYELRRTLSANGSVSRAICEVDSNGLLAGIVEYPEIDQNSAATLPQNALVSMNFWGFHISIFKALQAAFTNFLLEERYYHEEFYLQPVIDQLITQDRLRVSVIPGNEPWHGITHPADRASVQAALRGRDCNFNQI